jgi:CII-binding regulator of phage lambda lysogenization HflD
MELLPSNDHKDLNRVKDKRIQKILKSIHKLKTLNSQQRSVRYEELIRYILAMMQEKRADGLLQTTALWSLLNLIQLDRESNIDLMLRVGAPAVLSEILKIPNQSDHTRKYASQLISELWSVFLLLCSSFTHLLSFIRSLSQFLRSKQG